MIKTKFYFSRNEIATLAPKYMTVLKQHFLEQNHKKLLTSFHSCSGVSSGFTRTFKSDEYRI